MIDYSSVDFIDLLENRLGLRNVRMTAGGVEIVFSCPRPEHAHGDESPSAYLNSDTGAMFCHACKLSGAAPDLVAEVQQTSRQSAERFLREIYGVTFNEPIGGSMAVETDLRFREALPEPPRIAPPESWLASVRVDWDAAYASPQSYEAYMLDRGLMPSTLVEWSVGYDFLSDRLTIPVRDLDGVFFGVKGRDWTGRSFAKYMNLGNVEGRRLNYGFDTYEVTAVVFGLHRAREHRVAVLCYSPDTEVLTRHGWVAFPNLSEFDEILQVYEDMSGDFVCPLLRQKFRYSGDLINVVSDWCDLLVTPDHRMLGRAPKCLLGERRADDLPANFLMRPSCNSTHGSVGPSSDEAKLLVAWAADGCRVARAPNRRCWNLKKERKKNRLRSLLSAVGARYKEHDSVGMNQGWTMFWVEASSVPFLDVWMPDKKWHMGILDWPLDTRKISVLELAFWDGDQNSRSIRFFTAEQDQSEAVCAVASSSGWGCTMRVDRRENRPEQQDQYILNLSPRLERKVSRRRQTTISFDGYVFCCTVPSGWILTRRNGKTVVSGNCEGELDAMALSQMGVPRPVASGRAGLSPRQVELLVDECDEVVVYYDRGPAGEQATDQAVELLEPRLRVRVVEPLDVDPCDALRIGREREVLRAVAKARSSLTSRPHSSRVPSRA